MKCTNCGHDLVPGDLFCTSCGAPCIEPGPPCSACGIPGTPGDVFCRSCGASLMPDEPPPAALVRSVAFGAPVPFVVRIVPGEGRTAYDAPLDTATAERVLTPGQPVILRRRAGEWAFVWAEDGWMGWVHEAGLVDPDDPDGIFRPEVDDADVTPGMGPPARAPEARPAGGSVRAAPRVDA